MLLNNRYQVVKSIGAGGFGATFLAEDTQMPSRRKCVVKKLHPASQNRQTYQLIQERFQREAAILENLGNQSDRIPTLYAYFEENNDFYLVQELIDGITLTDKIQSQSSFSESYVKQFLVDFLQILDYVHHKNIIHRDIKPDNIIIRQTDQKPVLIDFGAVKEAVATTITTSGSPHNSIVIGTPGFMSVEQNAGRPVYSSDLYATGLTAIYLLTGKPPHDLETDSYTGEILWKQYAPQISPSLAAILDKAIATHIRDRYPTAHEMLQALQSPTSQYYQDLRPTIAENSQKSHQSTVISQPPSKLGYLPQNLLPGSLIAIAIIAGFWITKQPEQSSHPITKTPPIAAPAQPSPSPSPAQASPTSPNVVVLVQPAAIAAAPTAIPQPQPAAIAAAPTVIPQPQPAAIYPPTIPNQPQPTVTLPKPIPVANSQISIKLLDQPELYLASTTLIYSDGDRLKADFRIYCPTSTMRPTNYILTNKQGTVKKAGAWWEGSFTPKYTAEYQLIKEVCNKN